MSDGVVWYLGIQGQQQGPLGTQQIIDMIRAGQVDQTAYVYGQTHPQWTPIAQVAAFAPLFHAQPPPPPPPPSGPAPLIADQIDFEIVGQEMQFVEIVLDPGEAAIAEAGSFFYMDPGIRMETIFGDGSQVQQGFFGKLAAGAKRVLTGESLFMTVFGNGARERQKVAFAAPYPGKIVPIDLRQHGGTLLCQKDAFLCAARASPSASHGTSGSAPACSAARGSSSRSSRARGWRSSTPGERSSRATSRPARPCGSTPAASSRSSRASRTTSSGSVGSRRRCSVARACSSRR